MSVGINWRGGWTNSNTYQVGDAVFYLGSSYIALDINTYVIPSSNTASWSLLVAQGQTGPQGIQGVQGATGIGTPGPTGQAGPLGQTGQGLTWRNTYNAISTYNPYDIVFSGGYAYICIADEVTGLEPSANPSQWGVFTTGVVGPVGPAGPLGPTGEVTRAQLTTLQTLVTDYAVGSLTNCGNATYAVDSSNPGVTVSVAPCLVTESGWLESISLPIASSPAGGTLDINVYTYQYPNLYTRADHFAVTLSAAQLATLPAIVTFLAGVDYAPRQVAKGSYLGWTATGTVAPGYNSVSASGTAGFAIYNGNPGAGQSTWTATPGTIPLGCSVRGLAAQTTTAQTTPYTGKRIIALGDSLTSSYGHSLYQNTPYQQDNNPAPCYAEIASAQLGAVWNGRFSTAGIDAGRYYEPDLTHAANVAAAAPNADVCLIFLGTNQRCTMLGSITDAPVLDLNGTASFYAQMRYVIETTQEFNPAMQIIGLLPFQNGNLNGPSQIPGGFGGTRDNLIMSDHGRTVLVQVRAALMEIYSFYGIPWIDLWTVLGINQFNAHKYLPVDYVHFDDAGYQFFGTRVADAMLCLDSSYIAPTAPAALTSLDNCPIGQTTPAAGMFTTIGTQSGNLLGFSSVGRDIYGSIDFGPSLLFKSYSGLFNFTSSAGVIAASVTNGVYQETFAPPASSSAPGKLGQFTDGQLVPGGPFYRFLCVIDNPNGTVANAWVRSLHESW